MQPMLNVALRAVRSAAEELVVALERLDRHQATEQELVRFMAECAIGTEKKVIFALRRAYPDHAFYGYETTDHDSHEDPKEANTVWLVNAIEGMENFKQGLPNFAITVTCMEKGKASHAVIMNPISGEVFAASRGRGAQYNGRRIRTGEKAKLAEAVIGVNYPGMAQNDRNTLLRKHITQLSEQSLAIRAIGSNALTVAYVAAGFLDGAVLNDTSEFALRAGELIAKEAGCLVSDYSGGVQINPRGDLVVANGRVLKALLVAIQNK